MLKKLPVLFLIWPALYPVESFAQQYQLSPRLGDVIDQNERDYFYLFPSVSGYISAKTFLHGDRAVDIVINSKQNGSDTEITYRISRLLADHLVTFIEGFESVREKKASVNWELLGSLVWNGPALESKMIEGSGVKIIKRNGEQVSGKLLWADDSLVILWHNSDDYSWRLTDQSATVVRYFDIGTITIESESKFWTGFGIGALIGGVGAGGFVAIYSNALSGYVLPETVLGFGAAGTAGVGLIGGLIGSIFSNDIHLKLVGNPDKYFYDALPVLREKEMFSDHLAPELLRLIKLSPPQTAKDMQATRTSDTVFQFVEPAIHHIIYAEGAIGFSNGSISLNYERPLSRYFWFRAGLGLGQGEIDEYYGTPGGGWGPLVMTLFLSQGTSKFEFGLGASLILAARQRYPYYDSPSYEYVWGLHPAITLGYRYQPEEGGLIFRLGGGYTYYNGYPFEVSVGWGF